MTEPSTRFTELNNEQIQTRTKIAICGLGTFVCTHLLLMIILVANIAIIGPSVKATLSDVQIMMPEMRRTIVELGALLPEIKQGMNILSQLCDETPECTLTLNT